MTKEQRLKAAGAYVSEKHPDCNGNKPLQLLMQQKLKLAFIKGAEAEAESIPKWLIFEEMTKEEKLRLNSHPQNLIICLFENGDLLKYEEDLPCSALSKVYFLPTP